MTDNKEMTAENQNAASPLKKTPVILRVLQGALIGVGGILPGISGGVLCAIFGLYQPIMDFFAHPIKNFKTHFKYLLPAGIGLVVGFLGLAKLVELLFRSNEVIAVCIFTGLILGMLPSLWNEAGEKGRKKSSYITMAIGFAVVFAAFLTLELAASITVTPNKWWFLVSGVLFGLGIVVPGMSASSPLLFLGLMEPLLEVASSFMDSVILFLKGGVGFGAMFAAMRFDAAIPFVIGAAVIFIALSKLVSRLLETNYSEMYHGIFGVVIGTTLPILIFKLGGGDMLIVKILCIVGGFFAAYFLDKLSRKLEK